jgi:NADPH-dependent curcumin reductase CurA
MTYIPREGEAIAALTKAIQEDKLKLAGAETIVDTKGNIEEIPKVYVGLFEGINTGKLITKV